MQQVLLGAAQSAPAEGRQLPPTVLQVVPQRQPIHRKRDNLEPLGLRADLQAGLGVGAEGDRRSHKRRNDAVVQRQPRPEQREHPQVERLRAHRNQPIPVILQRLPETVHRRTAGISLPCTRRIITYQLPRRSLRPHAGIALLVSSGVCGWVFSVLLQPVRLLLARDEAAGEGVSAV